MLRAHQFGALAHKRMQRHYVEVKNCHMVYPDGNGYCPDSVSVRASRQHTNRLNREEPGANISGTSKDKISSGSVKWAPTLHTPKNVSTLRDIMAHVTLKRFAPVLYSFGTGN
eukprot:6465173-Amphidinium_carterae.2